jgi:hypothetical protein
MQLAQLWRRHLQAGCPIELKGVQIAGTDARALDAEITSCVSAMLTRQFTIDGRMERRLADISSALSSKEVAAEAPVAEFCHRLNQLVSAVLTETRAGRAQ